MLPTDTKWKNIHKVCRIARCGAISLSKLSVLKTNSLGNTLLKRPRDKFAKCTACHEYKGLRDAHPIETELHTRHQRKYIEHVNNQEVHREDYNKNCALFIMRPTEVLTVIQNKMYYTKTVCPCYTCKIKATYDLFKLPVAVTSSWRFPNVFKGLRIVLV